MNHYFILWYYTRGLLAVLLFSKNTVRYIWHRFHVATLVATFISPWKRDVAFRDWRGLHPILALHRLFENLISRFLGMLVRFVVISMGIVTLLVSVPLVILVVLYYIVAPVLMVMGLFTYFSQALLSWYLLSGLIGIFVAYWCYRYRERDVVTSFDISSLKRLPWFRNILGRLGLRKKDLHRDVLKNNDAFLKFLEEHDIDQTTLELAVRMEEERERARLQEKRIFAWDYLKKSVPLGRGWQYAYTPHLDRYCDDLSRSDSAFKQKLVGRENILNLMLLALTRPTQNGVLLVGNPGIGKKTIVHHVARLIRENELGEGLAEVRVLVFDIGRAISDATNRGNDVSGMLRLLFGEVIYAGNIILVLENIDTILGSGAAHPQVAAVLGEFLPLPGFRLVATVTPATYHALAKIDEQMWKYFEVIFVPETTEAETLQILFDVVRRRESRPVFTLPALLAIIAQSSKFRWEVPFPERALDLAEEVFTYWRSQGQQGGSFITKETVEACVSLRTGMPTGTIGNDEKEKLLHLEEYLHERVIGQHEAIRQVAEAMRRARAGFGDAKRPLGSFIFLGPTGVGKTETVKALAASYFGDEDHMIRLDMSEYQTPEAVSRLIGSEALGQTGQLTDIIKEKPFSILLLDELEKAYPKALDVFLQILDEGFVTDSKGEKVSFRNTIIIATSNAGATIIKAGMDEKRPFTDIRKEVLDYVVRENIYRLEFLNRFDGVIFFEPLKQEELLQVTAMKLAIFAARLKKEKNIAITFAPGVAEKIVERGYEPEFGARSLNRFIEDTIEDVVIGQMIAGSVTSGGTLVITPENL